MITASACVCTTIPLDGLAHTPAPPEMCGGDGESRTSLKKTRPRPPWHSGAALRVPTLRDQAPVVRPGRSGLSHCACGGPAGAAASPRARGGRPLCLPDAFGRSRPAALGCPCRCGSVWCPQSLSRLREDSGLFLVSRACVLRLGEGLLASLQRFWSIPAVRLRGLKWKIPSVE